MSNWFLLVQSIAEEPNMDWSEFAGPHWRESVQSFARELAPERGLEVVDDGPWRRSRGEDRVTSDSAAMKLYHRRRAG